MTASPTQLVPRTTMRWIALSLRSLMHGREPASGARRLVAAFLFRCHSQTIQIVVSSPQSPQGAQIITKGFSSLLQYRFSDATLVQIGSLSDPLCNSLGPGGVVFRSRE